ncbi:hypothetical protein D3C84_1002810 [compost metagenome]
MAWGMVARHMPTAAIQNTWVSTAKNIAGIRMNSGSTISATALRMSMRVVSRAPSGWQMNCTISAMTMMLRKVPWL